MLFFTGLASFAATLAGQGSAYLQYSHYILLVMSSLYGFHLLLQRRIVVTNITLFIAAYILLRIIAVSAFALTHEYTLFGYVYPLKNWFLLLISFVIGQSIEQSTDTVNRAIMKALFITVMVLLVFEFSGFFLSPQFSQSFPLPSRVSLIKYRIGIDEFIIVYAYLLLSLTMIRDELRLSKYLTGITVILLAILISQTKQILAAIIVVSLFLIIKRHKDYLTKRKCLFTIFFTMTAVAILAGLYLLMTTVPTDTYLSLWRRGLAIQYVYEKVRMYPIFGYPIPSNLFGGTIPKDISHYFYGFNFDITIFPSDIPLLFILAEEGIAGILYITAFLYLCYKKAPDKAPYVIVALLSLVGTYRMYYLIPVGSSFTYFMLGLVTRKHTDG
jgi:hypothetical protein